ncbi:MAG: universal stress protein [Candidatus Omnitrophica bacterium]|nr:universal stress protein [Candidatus Omnitrophota bacterium]MCM8771358.1 universal stress protein [Candidatus Omnitrophota bacterium]
MQFKKILVPIDFSHFSKKALLEAVKLAACCRGKIYLLHVEEDIFQMTKIHKIHPPLEKVCAGLHKDFVMENKKMLGKFKNYIPQRLFGGAFIKEGHPFVEIIKFAQGHCMDVIILSSRGRSDIKHALLGSVAEKVARKALCPVLLIKDRRCKSVSF